MKAVNFVHMDHSQLTLIESDIIHWLFGLLEKKLDLTLELKVKVKVNVDLYSVSL